MVYCFRSQLHVMRPVASTRSESRSSAIAIKDALSCPVSTVTLLEYIVGRWEVGTRIVSAYNVNAFPCSSYDIL